MVIKKGSNGKNTIVYLYVHASIFVSFWGTLYAGDAYLRTFGGAAHPLEEFFLLFF